MLKLPRGTSYKNQNECVLNIINVGNEIKKNWYHFGLVYIISN